MVRADAASPSYIALGAVFPTTLKAMATAPQGLVRLGDYARLLRGYPRVAIGGIDASRRAAVLATGVGSVAVVRALVAAADPEATALAIDGATISWIGGEHAVEVAGTRGAAQPGGEPLDVDGRARAGGVHLGDRGREHQVDALGVGDGGVARRIPRVGG